MRVGIHTGRFFTADIGTPRRMEHVLLGTSVQRAKQAEGAGLEGRVNVTMDAYERVKDLFRFEEGKPGHMLVKDDLATSQLGEFDISSTGRRMASAVLFDRSVEALVTEVEHLVGVVEPLAAYIPDPILNVLIENAARREIPPDFVYPTVLFVNLNGLPESVDMAKPEEEPGIVSSFSHVFALINAAVEARGGVLKKVTYHLAGSDIMIFFGVPTAHTDDALRAAEAALTIRDIITAIDPPVVAGKKVEVNCQIGLSRGPCFAAEIGEPRGRREFNVLGDTVNTAARLMGRAVGNRIMITEWVQEEVKDVYKCDNLGTMTLKGKEKRIPIFALNRRPGVVAEAD
jgi:class 3 adenylate cyclase